MRQANLPLIPNSAIYLGDSFSVLFGEKTTTWYHQISVIRSHNKKDLDQYRLCIAEMCLYSGIHQSVMARITGLHPNTITSYVSRLQTRGPGSFFEPSPVRGKSVLTDDVLAECQKLLNEGFSRAETASKLKIKKNTLDKAIRAKRLHLPVSPISVSRGSLPDARKIASMEAVNEMGMGCTSIGLRLAASVGALTGAPSRFTAALAVSNGGVLCALPALASNDLYSFLNKLSKPSENASFYYSITHVVTLLAFMALLRIKSVEALRREAPEELGTLLGLDRIPEVKCLRGRLKQLSNNSSAVQEWANSLSKQWLATLPKDIEGMLYVDGHVRAYYGKKAVLPRRFFSRMRLCLRGITDFWVNDGKGQPLFYVERQTNEGLLAVLRDDLVPTLLKDIPGADAPIEEDEQTPRFTLVFDREGYSPAFFYEALQNTGLAYRYLIRG